MGDHDTLSSLLNSRYVDLYELNVKLNTKNMYTDICNFIKLRDVCTSHARRLILVCYCDLLFGIHRINPIARPDNIPAYKHKAYLHA